MSIIVGGLARHRAPPSHPPRAGADRHRHHQALLQRCADRIVGRIVGRMIESLEPRQLLAATTPIISEFLADNGDTLADQDGAYSDWIELHNPTPAAVNLDGYFLTDDPALLTKWRIPSITLPAGGNLIIFASGKDRAIAGQELHANFALDAAGEYLALIKPDGAVAQHYAPQYPEQLEDISYGIAIDTSITQLIRAGDTVRTRIPSNDSLGTSWTAWDYNDASWSLGSSGVGFDVAGPAPIIPGFTARMVDIAGGTNGLIDHINDATSILDGTASPSAFNIFWEGTRDYSHINLGTGGNFGTDQQLPNGFGPSSGDQDAPQRTDYAIRATATLTIPAGQWTIAVNSDDGFRLRLPGISFINRYNQNTSGVSVGSDTLVFANPRGPGNTLGTFTIPSGGLSNIPLQLDFYERGGGDTLELAIAPGHHASHNGNFVLLADGQNGWDIETTQSTLPPTYHPLIGAGGDLESAMYTKSHTAYIRHPFTLDDAVDFDQLKLRMKYDDGFIAYLNGIEVVRRNAPTTPAYNSSASASHPDAQAFIFEEIDISQHRAALRVGGNILAIHGLNHADNAHDFLILPELDGLHLFPDQQRYFDNPTPGQLNDISSTLGFVEDTEFSIDRGFFDAPFSLAITTDTPDAQIRYTLNGDEPTATTGLLYTGPLSITGTTTLRAAAFKPGYIPSNVDTQTYIFINDVVTQSANGQAPPGWPTSWGANRVDYGMDPDIVNHPAYAPSIRDDLKSIPTISLVTDLDHLFDAATGIYANPGQDGRAWERPASIELINPDGSAGFQENAGIRIRGGYSRSTDNAKHAFRIFFRDDYGAGRLDFPLFGPDAAQSFDKFDLRTFQNYSWSFGGDERGVFVRDQFSRDTQLEMGHNSTRGQFVHLYINGQYWGLFNTEERPEAAYAASYEGGTDEDYDVIKVEAGPYTINATDGDMDAWTRLYNAMLAGFETPEKYWNVQGRNPDGTPNPAYENLLEVESLIDYMLVVFYTGNFDAPLSGFLGNTSPNNWYGIRSRTRNEGFKFIVHDSEHTLLLGNTQIGDGLTADRTGPYFTTYSLAKSNPQWLFQELAKNSEFRLRVADHIHRHWFNNGALTPQKNLDRFNARINEIHDAVVGESARWGDARRSTPRNRDVDWLGYVNRLRNEYFPFRSDIVLNQLKNDSLYPNLAAPGFNQHGGEIGDGFQLTISAPAGTIYYTLDGSDPRAIGGAIAPGALIYTGPIILTQTALARARVYSAGQWSALNEATFSFRPTQLRITEVMYNPAPGPVGTPYDAQDFEFIEVTNTGSTPMNLLGVRIAQGIDFTFGNLLLAGGQRAVVVKNPAAFQSRYGTGITIAGSYGDLSLSNGGERLVLESPQGEPLLDFTYSDGWYPQTDGGGYSLIVVDPLAANPAWSLSSNWRPSTPLHGAPGAPDPGLNGDAVVVNEVMSNTSDPDGDWIELHNTTAAAIDVGGWFLSDTNSDLRRYRIPIGTTIPANGYLVFRERTHFGLAGNPGVNTPFALSSAGEKVYLTSANPAGDLLGYRDARDFEAADLEVSFGRHVKSTGGIDFVAMNAPTQGAANGTPRVGPIVITELSYHPATGESEFVELRNLTGAAVPLYDQANPQNTWKFSDGITFTFPQGASIEPFGYALVVPIDPITFRTTYGVPAGVPIWQYTGALANEGENVTLVRPLAPLPDLTVPYAVVDRVRYHNTDPWPTEPAGNGPSLAKLNPGTYGNDAAHWSFQSQGSPGRENFDAGAPTVDIADVVPDPRNSPVTTVTLTFSEPVSGFNLADLVLTRNGGANLLTASQTLTTSDSVNFTLGNLAGLTGTAGSYVLTLSASGSGIVDLNGNALASSASDGWTTETTAPTADVVDIAPDPRPNWVNTITITFSEPVFNFDLADLSLTRDGGANQLSPSQTLSSSDNVTWMLGNLAGITTAEGSYLLTVIAAGINDAAGNAVAGNATDAWTVDGTYPTVDIIDVQPDPRNTSTASITIVFSEPVLGFDKNDLWLARDGGSNLISAAHTLTSSDSGTTWVLGGLSAQTGAEGAYTLNLNHQNSGITDFTGHGLGAGAGDAWTVDLTAPTADVVDVAPDPRNTGVGTISIAFSEPITGFDAGDLVLARNGGANLLTVSQTLSTIDSRTWTLSGLSTLTSAAGSYQLSFKTSGTGIADAAGNAITGSASDAWVVDLTAPTANIIDVVPDPRNSSVAAITITFSEAVAGVDIGDLVLAHDGGGNLLTASQTLTTADNITYTLGNLASLTGAGGSYNLTLFAAGSGITDAAGNALAADAADAWSTDTTAPTADVVNISPDPRNTNVTSYTINFSEPVFAFDLADLTLTRDGGSNLLTAAQTLTTTNNRAWTLGNVGPLTSTSGVHRLTVIAAGIHDAAGNAVAADATDTVTIDLDAPALDVVDVTPDPRNAAVSTITLVFSEPVTGLDLADVTLTRDGGANLLTALNLSTTDQRTYTIDTLGALTAAQGTYVLSVRSAGSNIRDAAGNELATAASDTWVTDSTAPTVDVVDVTPDPRQTPAGTITIAFSEPVTGFDKTDLTLTRNGGANLIASFHTLTSSDGGRTWVLGGLDNQTGPEGAYVLTLKAAGSGIMDLSGNALGSGASDAWTVDFTAPTADIVDVVPDPRNSAVDTITIVFTETVSGFDLSDLVLSRDGGANLLTASQTLSTTDGRTWTLGNVGSLTAASGSYQVSIKSSGTGIVDAGGIPLGGDGASDTFVVETDAPIVDIVDVTPDPRRNTINTISIIFSKAVTGFDIGDLTLTRDGTAISIPGTLSSTDNIAWALTGIGNATGPEGAYVLTLDAAGSGIKDGAGNDLAAGASDAWTVDFTDPTVDIIDVMPDPRDGAVDSIEIVFSEPVSGFDPTDLHLTRDGNGNLIVGSGATLTTADGMTWTLAGLAGVTNEPGQYALTLAAAGAGIIDAAGNALAADVVEQWQFQQTNTASIAGLVFLDRNSNGLPDDGDLPLSGWTVYLDADGDGTLDSGEASTPTGGDGRYAFAGLAPGTHVVRHLVPADHVAVSPAGASYSVDLIAGHAATDRNFGNFPTRFGNTPALRDRYTVRRSGDHIEIIDASEGSASAVTYAIPADLLPSLTFDTGSALDTLTIELTGGDPFPIGGISYDGGGDSSNILILIGSADADDIVITDSTVAIGDRTLQIAGISAVDLDGGGGDDGLTIAATDLGVRLDGDLTFASITAADGGRVSLAGSSAVMTTGELLLAPTAQLDLVANDLLVLGGNLDAIEQLVASARNGGATRWRGNGIATSAATDLAGLAVGMQGDDVVVKHSYNGDANLDGMINFDDYFRIDSAYLEQPANPAYEQGDFNYDGSINFDDYFLIDSAFLGQGEPLSHATSVAATAEAEPLIFAGETTSITTKRNRSRPRPSADLFSTMRIARKTVRRAGRA